MTTALEKERQLERRLLIPVVIDNCRAPPEVADRLYADFSAAYLSAFEALSGKLRAQNLHRAPVAVDRLLMPMTFHGGTHLDTDAFGRRLSHILPQLPAGFKFRPDHLVVHDDEFVALKKRIAERKEHIKEDSYYTPNFAVEFSKRYQHLLERERRLLEGVCTILNNLSLAGRTDFCNPVEICKWFALLWRSSNLFNWWRSQNPDRSDTIAYGRNCVDNVTGSDPRHYGVASVGALDIGPSPNGLHLADSFRIYVDEQELLYRNTEVYGYLVLVKVLGYGSEIMDMYVLPQMVARMMLGFDEPFTWTFEGYFCGRG
jgi:hypothetical protein